MTELNGDPTPMGDTPTSERPADAKSQDAELTGNEPLGNKPQGAELTGDKPTSVGAPDAKPTLFIDADACPVTRDALACARRVGVPCVVAGDSGHNLLRHVRADDPTEPNEGFWVRVLQVAQGQDSADFAIVCELEPGDVVVTQDFGLASMALGRGAAALDPRGHVFDKRTIDALLLVRHAQKEARRDQRKGKRPKDRHPAFTEDDRARFVRELRALLEAALH